VDTLVRIARGAHIDSRFFFDSRFDREKAALLYETWIRKACDERSGRVFVGDLSGEPVGYLTTTMLEENRGQLGLMAVDERFHGRGIGRAMLEESLRWFASQGVDRVSVVTQGRNVPAQRLYQAAGFLVRHVECWYHRWFA
jgi:ribosomal protein S18 acetylase RimI-like enzyme